MHDASRMPHALAGRDRSGAGDILAYAPGCGCQVIHDFQNGVDTIDLRAFGFGDVEALLACAVARDGGVVIDFGRGDTLTIEGIHLALFDGSDFRL